MAERTCTINGCDSTPHARGLCHRHYSQAWYHANRDRARAQQAQYRATRRDVDRERVRAWRAANPDRVRDAVRAYHAAHTDAIRERRREYRDANRDKIRALNNRRKAMQRNVEINDLTPDEWVEIIARSDGRCAYCGCVPDRITMDHVIPLSRGGNHTASNVVPACGPCNSRKGDGPAPPFVIDA